MCFRYASDCRTAPCGSDFPLPEPGLDEDEYLGCVLYALDCRTAPCGSDFPLPELGLDEDEYLSIMLCASDCGLYLVIVSSHHQDWGFGGMAGDGAEPEVQTGMFVAQTNVPQQQVHCPV